MSDLETRRARLGRLAASQHGLFTRKQVLALGFSPELIRLRVRQGAWDVVVPGVYAIRGCPWTWRRKLMLAVLDIGGGAVVSHRSAAVLHGFPGFRPGGPELTVVRGVRGSGRWNVHTTRELPRFDRVKIDGLPATSTLRTLFDLAGVLAPSELERLVDELLAARVVGLGALALRLGRHRRQGRRGVVALARVLDIRGPGYVPPASELEALLREVLESGGNPQPDWQSTHPAGPATGRVDAVYEWAKLILEVDGRRWHSQVAQMEADRHRDIAASLAGYHTMRFMWGDLVMRPAWVNDVVRQYLRRYLT
jgi:hypothetical protein